MEVTSQERWEIIIGQYQWVQMPMLKRNSLV